MSGCEINSLIIQKGSDFNETFKIYEEDGTPLIINSSFSGVSKIRKHPTSDIAFPFDLYLDIHNSSVNISMASTVTAQLPFSGRCCFDILLTYGFSEQTTKKFVKGTILVEDTASL